MVCLGNMCMDTPRKGDNDDDDDDDDDNNNNNNNNNNNVILRYLNFREVLNRRYKVM